MGRKAIDRERKPLTKKAKEWVKQLTLLLQDKNLDQITLDDLAHLSGRSKSTIYTYFSAKEEIYLTGVKLILEDLAPLTTEVVTAGEDMESVLRGMMLGITEGIKGISIHFLEQLKTHYPQIWLVIVDFTDKILNNLSIIYEKGMREGTFRQFNIGLLMELDSYFVMSVMTDTKKISRHEMSFNTLVAEYLELRISALKI